MKPFSILCLIVVWITWSQIIKLDAIRRVEAIEVPIVDSIEFVPTIAKLQ